MTYDEMSKFSYGELSGFTYGELHRTPKELIEQIRSDGSELPYDVYGKLLKICDDINKELEKNGMDQLRAPENSPKGFSALLSVLLYIVTHYKGLKESFESFLDSIFDLFN
jgi:hypothetical protein